MSACIYFHPEAYTTNTQKLMGRNAAGESFLKGYLSHGKRVESLWVRADQDSHYELYKKLAQTYNRIEPVKLIRNINMKELASPGMLYYPGPDISHQASLRRFRGDSLWSICGITHTTSSFAAMDAICDWLTSSVAPWDAVICPSTAVKNNVETILEARREELTERLGITKTVLPKLPVIPLGINADDFRFSPAEKEISRRKLGIDEDSIVILYTGRLSFHAKAHPIQMYRALEQAANITRKKLTLVESGWHANDYIKDAFKEATVSVCPSVVVKTLDGRLKDQRDIAWSCADIFCSLSDNIQETFGIVPLEAMAVGLPLVVSDWDGYRDTVLDGEVGFRIPTIFPRPGLAGDLAYRHALGIDSYDMYCGHSSSFVAVDSIKLVDALVALINSKKLRQDMGEAGRRHVRQNYDWKSVIPLYENLWSELDEIRAHANRAMKNGTHSSSARLDPTEAFKTYPTKELNLDTVFLLPFEQTEAAIHEFRKVRDLTMVNYAPYVMMEEDDVSKIILVCASSQNNCASAKTILEAFPRQKATRILRGLTWLAKLGILVFR